MSNDKYLLEVKDLKQHFNIPNGLFGSKKLKAVDGVSFAIKKGETLGLVGESGCGKTTVGRSILHLYQPTSGEVIYDGKVIKTKKDVNEMRKKVQMVFQDPYSSLDPRMTVADIIGEPLDIHKLCKTKAEREARAFKNSWFKSRARNTLCPRILRRSASANRHCPCSCS